MHESSGLVADELFVGATRPATKWGVAFPALLLNFAMTMELFLMTKNLLTLLIAIPVHGICALLCARDARFFDLLLLWCLTRVPAYLGNARVWAASSYSPLALDLPDLYGKRAVRDVAAVIAVRRGSEQCHR